MSQVWLVATRSAGKLAELRPLFRDAGYDVVDLAQQGVAHSTTEDDVECFETFEENALAKARYFFSKTGIPTIADDSGLEVVALGGAPGVRSKRWSAERGLQGDALDAANNAKLVEALGSVDDRRARYVCAAAYVDKGREVVRRGTVEGEIVLAPRGDGGFGYDPYFWSPELGCTFGEASREEKEVVSHRGRAFRALLEELRR